MRAIGLLSSVLLLAGCTHHYVPADTTFNIPHTLLDRVVGGAPVALVNTQDQTKDLLVIKLRGHKWYGNMNEWSETAIRYIKLELNKKDIPIAAGSPRSIGVEVISSKCTNRTWTLRCETTLGIRLGDGDEKTYLGDNASPATLARAIDGSLMRAVTAMFNDDEVIAYLQGTQ